MCVCVTVQGAERRHAGALVSHGGECGEGRRRLPRSTLSGGQVLVRTLHQGESTVSTEHHTV